MANKLSAYIDLLKLQGAYRMTLKNKAGVPVDCVVVVLPQSRVRLGKNGGANLSLEMVPNKQGPDDYGNTHWLCEPTTKEEREGVNPPKFPILGNAREFDGGVRAVGGGVRAVGGGAAVPERPAAAVSEMEVGDDEIPF